MKELTTSILVRLPVSLHPAVVELARRNTRSVNGQIVHLLRQAIEQERITYTPEEPPPPS